jgi:hypothetical protein
MRIYRTAVALTVLSIVAAGSAVAQTAPTQDNGTTPSSASSPHQRAATSNNATEAPANNGADPSAASTPHQQQATQGAMAGHKAMKDCMAKEKAKNSAASKADMKKACASQVNSNTGQSKNE